MNDSYYLVANIKGDISSSNLNGTAYFRPFKDGTLVEVEINNLPGNKSYELFPIHIHDGIDCEISNLGTFGNVKEHYNPDGKEHPYHVGDMPVLFSNSGYAYMRFYTTRFKPYDIENKLVIVHEAIKNENEKVFGRKIGCGKIKLFKI